jgi:hypothetical protein
MSLKRISAAELPVATEIKPGITVGLIVDGWAEDLAECVKRYLEHTDAKILLLDMAADESSNVAAQLAEANPARIELIRVDRMGWSKAVVALLKASATELVAIADISTLLEGDALTPLADKLRTDLSLAAVGWKGVNIDLDSNWFESKAAIGEVDQLLGYLMLVKREIGIAHPPHKDARFYRNADMEWSLAMREAGFKLWAIGDSLPAVQGRHHGYFDTDPEYRDAESKKTYGRMLKRFRGKTEILAPRS